MATKRKHTRFFEELGLLDNPPPSNPYKDLGLDPDFAAELLREDPNGEVVKFAAGALYKALSRRYHPDVPLTGDGDRFRTITEAHSRIAEAAKASLAHWSKQEQTKVSGQADKLRSERESLTLRAAELLQTDLELGSHPKHFSRLEWSQGILLQRANSPLLLRQSEEGDLQVLRGRIANPNKIDAEDLNPQVFDFQQFLLEHELFGLEPDTRIVTYIDQNGRASILAPDLTFIMDITDPITKRRKRRTKQPEEMSNDVWSRSPDPLLLIANTPKGNRWQKTGTQIITFPNVITAHGITGYNQEWNIPMEVVGTVADHNFFNRMKHAKVSGPALGGGNSQQATNHFRLVPVKTRTLIEQDAGYTPLLADGNSLLLYDPRNKMPIISDAKVMGMIGSDAQAT